MFHCLIERLENNQDFIKSYCKMSGKLSWISYFWLVFLLVKLWQPCEGYQLYTIHMLINQSNKTIPLVYCISKNKDAITYNRVLELLMERRVLNPSF